MIQKKYSKRDVNKNNNDIVDTGAKLIGLVAKRIILNVIRKTNSNKGKVYLKKKTY